MKEVESGASQGTTRLPMIGPLGSRAHAALRRAGALAVGLLLVGACARLAVGKAVHFVPPSNQLQGLFTSDQYQPSGFQSVRFISDTLVPVTGEVVILWTDATEPASFNVWRGHINSLEGTRIAFSNNKGEEDFSGVFSPSPDECTHPYGQIRLYHPWGQKDSKFAWSRQYMTPFKIFPTTLLKPLAGTGDEITGFYINKATFKAPCTTRDSCSRHMLLAGTMVVALDSNADAKALKLLTATGKPMLPGRAITAIYSPDGGSFIVLSGRLTVFHPATITNEAYYDLYMDQSNNGVREVGKLTASGLFFSDNSFWERSSAGSWYPRETGCSGA